MQCNEEVPLFRLSQINLGSVSKVERYWCSVDLDVLRRQDPTTSYVLIEHVHCQENITLIDKEPKGYKNSSRYLYLNPMSIWHNGTYL